MDGIQHNNVTLFLMEVPNRAGLAFAFKSGGIIYPVAYVSKQHEKEAKLYWQQMLGGLKEAHDARTPD